MGIPNRRKWKIFLGSLLAGASAFACAHTVVVEIPPKIDLQPYKTIGIVEFASNSRENLNQVATQKFMGFIQNAQPRVRFLELGPEDQLARKLGRESLDIEAIKAVGIKYGVSSIFTGPGGFAHGFCVLSDLPVVEYKCTDFYDPGGEAGLLWNDPDLGIDWPVQEPILSPRDQGQKRFVEVFGRKPVAGGRPSIASSR